ncbi:hypothetical protein HHL23_12440 [Chryseobacterium sp. RP-3-3]|uniref:Uncharacterized protein n=1 Tax=Chryseobacterium antibioticum TaxID=2728847 RepID=A0A7Y0ANI9_9FLAO|nr:hypothetical protein [Chryseobacterium antibioticum]NML70608.1 hypothetical protein [Chryseobacterium antibioticum]
MNQNLNSPLSTKRIVLNIFKWIFGLFFSFIGLVVFFNASYVGGFLIIIAGFLLIPPISNKLKEKVNIWREFVIRLIFTMVILFLGVLISSIKGMKSESLENKKAIQKYVKANKNKPMFKNLQLLQEWENTFDLGNTDQKILNYSEKNSVQYQPLDTLNDGSITYRLFLNNNKYESFSTKQYLKPIKNFGQLKNYFIVFTVTKKNEVVKTVAMFENDKNNVQEISDMNFDLSQYAELNLIKVRREKKEKGLAEIQKKEEEEKYLQELQEKKMNWKKNCISGWDGSCTKLVRTIKPNLLDPKSFEHIDTSFKMMNDYVTVIMQYRAKNAFGAYNIGIVTAKVSYDCEVLEISE